MMLHSRCRSGRLSRSSATSTSGINFDMYSSRMMNLDSASRPACVMLAARTICLISGRFPSSGGGSIIGLKLSRASSDSASSGDPHQYITVESLGVRLRHENEKNPPPPARLRRCCWTLFTKSLQLTVRRQPASQDGTCGEERIKPDDSTAFGFLEAQRHVCSIGLRPHDQRFCWGPRDISILFARRRQRWAQAADLAASGTHRPWRSSSPGGCGPAGPPTRRRSGAHPAFQSRSAAWEGEDRGGG